MDIQLILAVSCAVMFVFLIIQAVFLWRLSAHYNKFLKGKSGQGLMGVFEGIQKTLTAHESQAKAMATRIAEIEESGKTHLQRLVVSRFNPFNNTGGDQSFILGLLDGKGDGVVITSLHSRENTRFYVKSVNNGEGDPHPLSDDEKKILKKTRKDTK
jgi:hypothetical protein